MTSAIEWLLGFGAVVALLAIVLADAFSRRRDNLDDHRFD